MRSCFDLSTHKTEWARRISFEQICYNLNRSYNNTWALVLTKMSGTCIQRGSYLIHTYRCNMQQSCLYHIHQCYLCSYTCRGLSNSLIWHVLIKNLTLILIITIMSIIWWAERLVSILRERTVIHTPLIWTSWKFLRKVHTCLEISSQVKYYKFYHFYILDLANIIKQPWAFHEHRPSTFQISTIL